MKDYLKMASPWSYTLLEHLEGKNLWSQDYLKFNSCDISKCEILGKFSESFSLGIK